MGKWCDYECLSGSDGALRLALGLCDAAGNSYTTWPDDVQAYSHLKPDYLAFEFECLTVKARVPMKKFAVDLVVSRRRALHRVATGRAAAAAARSLPN